VGNVIFVSHNINEIKRICDIGIYIENGQIKIYDDLNEAAKRYQQMIKG
jgi:capsular polysaccharide transport system ATP-binding protein